MVLNTPAHCPLCEDLDIRYSKWQRYRRQKNEIIKSWLDTCLGEHKGFSGHCKPSPLRVFFYVVFSRVTTVFSLWVVSQIACE